MRKATLLFVLLALCGTVLSNTPTDFYTKTREQGIAAFNKGDYPEARRITNVVRQCPTKPQHDDIGTRIQKCDDRETVKSKPSLIPEQPSGNGKIHSLDVSVRSICYQNRKGVEVTASFIAENMKGETIHSYCQIWPEWDYASHGNSDYWIAVDGKVNMRKQMGYNKMVSENYSKTRFNVYGSPGQKGRDITVEENYERFSEIYFIPFGAMDLPFYEDQSFTTMVVVHQSDGEQKPKEILGSTTLTFATSPISLKVNGSSAATRSTTIPYEGGYCDFKINVCGEIEWLNVPSWISAEQGTLTIEENKSTEEREATMTLSPLDGGNKIEITVKQNGAPAQVVAAPKAGVTINHVRQEHNASVKGRYYLKIHLKMDIDGKKGEEVMVTARFFTSDGTTPLLDADGNPVICQDRDILPYDNTSYNDFPIGLENSRFMRASNMQGNEVKFVICVSLDHGETCSAQSGPYTISW